MVNLMNSFETWEKCRSSINGRYSSCNLACITSSKQLFNHLIQSLLSVKSISLSDISLSGYISLIYKSSFYFSLFEITNNGNCRPNIPIASIKDIHLRFSAYFIKVHFLYFKNTTLDLLAISIIYQFSVILYPSFFNVLYLYLIDYTSQTTLIFQPDLLLEINLDQVYDCISAFI